MKLFHLALSLAALVVAVWALAPFEKAAEAHSPHPGIDFSIALEDAGCDSTTGPTTCTIDAGATFTLQLKLNSFGDLTGYDAYNSLLRFTEVELVGGSLVQAGAGVWPQCVLRQVSHLQMNLPPYVRWASLRASL
jgi:hypothetical protein